MSIFARDYAIVQPVSATQDAPAPKEEPEEAESSESTQKYTEVHPRLATESIYSLAMKQIAAAKQKKADLFESLSSAPMSRLPSLAKSSSTGYSSVTMTPMTSGQSICSQGGPEPLAKEPIKGFHSHFTATDRIRANGWTGIKKQKKLEVVEVITTEEGEVTDIIVKRDADDIGEGDTRRIVVNQREE
jgi:hypothetical protein